MASGSDADVGLRLRLLGRPDVQAGLRGTRDDLNSVGAAGETAARGLSRLGDSKLLGGLAGAARGVATAAAAAGAALAASGTAAAVSLVKTGVAYNDLEQRSKAAFTTILGSEQAAVDMMSQIRTFGRTSPFPRQAFISATQQLLAFGFQAKDIIPTLQTINDATAAVGGNADTIATITDVFAKIQSAGKVGTEDLNRLGAVGINGFEAIAKATGKSIDGVRKDLKDGNIDAAKGIGALTDYMNSRFAGASENVKKTWSGAVDRVKGAWRDLGSAIVEPFVSTGGGGAGVAWANHLADGLRMAANAAPFVTTLLRTGKTDGAALAKIIGPESMTKVVSIAVDLRDAFLAIVQEASHYGKNLNAGQSVLDALVWGASALLRVTQGVVGLFAILARGDYTGNLYAAFGWAEDSKPIDYLLRIRDGFLGLAALVGSGDYTARLYSAFGWAEDSAVVDFLLNARDAVVSFGSGIAALVSGNMPQAQRDLGSIWTSLQQLTPAFTAFRDAMPSMATYGTLAGNALTLLAGTLQILADHVQLMVKLAPWLAGAFVIVKVATAASNAALAVNRSLQLFSIMTTRANILATREHSAALLQYAAALRGVSVAELQAQTVTKLTLRQRAANAIATARETVALAAQRVAYGVSYLLTWLAVKGLELAAWVRSTAATVASTAANLAAAAASLVVRGAVAAATAAQWLFNAALSANPIGLVVAAIALLVAGLVWFFTKTKLGQEAWAALSGGFRDLVGWITGTAVPAFRVGFAAAIDLAREKFDAVRDAVSGFVDKVKDALTWVAKLADKLTGGLVGKALGVVGVNIDGRASGGPVTGRTPYVVGEQGPELFVPGVSGSILPSQALASMLSRPAPVSVPAAGSVPQVNIDENDSTVSDGLATLSLTVPLIVDGREIARATVSGMHTAAAWT